MLQGTNLCVFLRSFGFRDGNLEVAYQGECCFGDSVDHVQQGGDGFIKCHMFSITAGSGYAPVKKFETTVE